MVFKPFMNSESSENNVADLYNVSVTYDIQSEVTTAPFYC